ncbi:MAG: hypothetical protein WCR70_07215 [Sphaerochaetaceae bacterium]|jgi:hypothetical protein
MILFVLEGKRREPAFFRTIEKLYFTGTESIICSYCNNIYNLFKEMSKSDFQMDIASVLHEKWKGTESDPFGKTRKASDFSEVFLFFDYDCHQQDKKGLTTIKDLNRQLDKMLEFFSEETANGKLYINYPMMESIRYTKKLPDNDYFSYEIPLKDVLRFKELATNFSFYKNLDEICFKLNNEPRELSPEQEEKVKRNWELLVRQNVFKANFICKGKNIKPSAKADGSQQALFNKECHDFVSARGTVSILNSFPLFLYEYFTVLINE